MANQIKMQGMHNTWMFFFGLIAILFGVNGLVWGQNLMFTGAIPSVNITKNTTSNWSTNLFVSSTFDLLPTTINNQKYPANDMQFYFQPSIQYRFSPALSVAASYTYQRNSPIQLTMTDEHRIWQQISYAKNLKFGRITNRLRYEQRFMEVEATERHPLSTRLRFQIGYQLPLNGPTIENNEWYLLASNEFYFSLTGVVNARYSENWSVLAMGYQFSPKHRIEAGYMLQKLVRNPQKDIRTLNLLTCSWVVTLPAKQKTSITH